MNPVGIVSLARSRKVRLYVDRGRVGYRCRGPLPDDLRQLLEDNQAEVVAFLMLQPVLNWRDRKHWHPDKRPCRLCGKTTHLRDENGRPCHKVCAERSRANRKEPRVA